MTERKTWTRHKRRELLADVFEARRDLSGLAEAHELSPADLAEWIGREEVQRCLAGLCLLADLQTQLMLSRYRQVAVSELIKQASGGGEDSAATVEQARKACVDLLKADLKRADLPLEVGKVQQKGESAAGDLDGEVALLRAALFGAEEGVVQEEGVGEEGVSGGGGHTRRFAQSGSASASGEEAASALGEASASGEAAAPVSGDGQVDEQEVADA